MASRERPILCTAQEVRALLDERRVQLRRPMRGPKPECPDHGEDCPDLQMVRCEWVSEDAWTDGWTGYRKCPWGRPGDMLWVRETLQRYNREPPTAQYAADMTPVLARFVPADSAGRALWLLERPKVPSTHMPKWACRLWPRVESVRVERLQETGEWEWVLDVCVLDNDKEPVR